MRWYFLLIIMLLLLSACKKDIERVEIKKGVSADCEATGDVNINQLMKAGNDFSFNGNNCSLRLEVKEILYDSVKFRFYDEKNITSDLDVDYKSSKYIESGFYIHVVEILREWARVVIDKNRDIDFSAQENKFRKCFSNPECMLSCDDANGFISDSCPDYSKIASSMPFDSKIIESEKCCIIYPMTYSILPSSDTYYVGDSLKLFFFGPQEVPCQITLKSPVKDFSQQPQQCQPFMEVLSKDFFSNYGEVFGNWTAKVKLPSQFGKNLSVSTSFIYKTGSLIFQDFLMEKGEKYFFKFQGKEYYLKHASGCNYGVKFSFWNGVKEKNFSMDVGASEELGGFSVNLRGAPCREGKPLTVRINKVMKSSCQNGYCEADETDKNCPWDCFEPDAINKSIEFEPKTSCTNGCFYDNTCIAGNVQLALDNANYTCVKNAWIKQEVK